MLTLNDNLPISTELILLLNLFKWTHGIRIYKKIVSKRKKALTLRDHINGGIIQQKSQHLQR